MVLAELGKEGLLPAVLINEIKNRERYELALTRKVPLERHEKCYVKGKNGEPHIPLSSSLDSFDYPEPRLFTLI